MNVSRLLFLLLTACICFLPAYSQNVSCKLQISMLTCSPGEDLYSVFGHSAIRVKDDANHTDLIYNYGTFDFEDPDFYIKFIKGKLLYFVSIERFDDFMYAYHIEKRSIIEQELHLTCNEKEKLNKALRNNAKEENKYYFYQFFFDNCSTRLRDIVSYNLNDTLRFKNILPVPTPTFRTMIHYYLDNGREYWSKAGIDLLLGSLIDKKPTNKEGMFLPDYLMKGFDSALENNHPIVSSKKLILSTAGSFSTPEIAASRKEHFGIGFTPITVTWILFATGFVFTFITNKRVVRFLNIFDSILFFVTGALGCMILFMWFGTEHDLCASNYNLLWALPTHVVIAFFVSSNKSWVKKYFAITSVLYLLIIFAWAFLPQGMNPAFFPLVLLAGLRSFSRSFLKKTV